INRIFKHLIIFYDITYLSTIFFFRIYKKVLIKYLNKFITIYINNILIYSNNTTEYKLYIQLVLKKLQIVRL
ncbi:hypothetical protein BO94DRAFT_480307, partial [Aspergillus sclerotioniger CBS 115572]